jgi:hypothetical protein
MLKLSQRQTSPRITTDNPFVAVKEVPLIRVDGVATNYRAIVNTETDKTMGQPISDRYHVTTHLEASNLVKEFLTNAGLEYQSLGARTATAGAKFYETLAFPDFLYNPIKGETSARDGHTLLKDDLVPTITIRNSYDKTSPVAWDYGMYRLTCANGMAVLEEQTKLSFKHTQIINPDRVRDLLLSNLENSSLLVSNIMNRLNGEQGTQFLIRLLQTPFSAKFKESLIEAVMPFSTIDYTDIFEAGKPVGRQIESVKTTESAYEIYNTVTKIASHEIGSRSEQDIVNRRIAKVFEVRAA